MTTGTLISQAQLILQNPKLKGLDTQFALRMAILLAVADLTGRKYVITSGFRSLEKQKELHSKGYPTAKSSWHTEKKALDIDADTNTLAYLGGLAPMLGLRWGGTFGVSDPIHFDFPVGNKPKNAY